MEVIFKGDVVTFVENKVKVVDVVDVVDIGSVLVDVDEGICDSVVAANATDVGIFDERFVDANSDIVEDIDDKFRAEVDLFTWKVVNEECVPVIFKL